MPDQAFSSGGNAFGSSDKAFENSVRQIGSIRQGIRTDNPDADKAFEHFRQNLPKDMEEIKHPAPWGPEGDTSTIRLKEGTPTS